MHMLNAFVKKKRRGMDIQGRSGVGAGTWRTCNGGPAKRAGGGGLAHGIGRCWIWDGMCEQSTIHVLKQLGGCGRDKVVGA